MSRVARMGVLVELALSIEEIAVARYAP